MELFGYVKANTLTEEYIIRQDMDQKNEPTSISKEYYKNKEFYANNKKINIKTNIFINEDGIGISNNFISTEGNYKNWTEISSNMSGSQIDKVLNDYKSRTEVIDTIIEKVLDNNINGIIINFDKNEQNDKTLRFVIEIAPKLREFGITTGIVLNENIEKNDYINIVDYIVE